jgi:hypothetical protein
MTEAGTGNPRQPEARPRAPRRLTLPADQQASRRHLPATLGSDRARHIEPCKTMRLLPSSPLPLRNLHSSSDAPLFSSPHQFARQAGLRRMQSLARLAVASGLLHA